MLTDCHKDTGLITDDEVFKPPVVILPNTVISRSNDVHPQNLVFEVGNKETEENLDILEGTTHTPFKNKIKKGQVWVPKLPVETVNSPCWETQKVSDVGKVYSVGQTLPDIHPKNLVFKVCDKDSGKEEPADN